MKSSIKRVLKFGKVVIVKTIKDFRKWSTEYALNERAFIRLQERMQADIEKVKERYRDQFDYHMEARRQMTPHLLEFAKTTWNGKSKKQEFDFIVVNWSIPRGSLQLASEEQTIEQLKLLGLTDLIRVTESVKKDEFKERFSKEPELMEKTFGATILKGDPTPEVEVNWQKIGSTLENEIKAAEREARVMGLAKAS